MVLSEPLPQFLESTLSLELESTPPRLSLDPEEWTRIPTTPKMEDEKVWHGTTLTTKHPPLTSIHQPLQAQNEEPSPPPPPEDPVLTPEIPTQEPPPPPPPREESPPPPTPETTALGGAGKSSTSPFVPVLSTSRASGPASVTSSPTPIRSFPPPFVPQSSTPASNIPQPFPKPSPPPRLPQSSSLAPVVIVVPAPTSKPQTQVPPVAQPTDAGSRTLTFLAPAAPSSTSLTDQHGAMGGNNSQGSDGNQSLVVALSSVFSVLGVVIIIGAICLCYRHRHGRLPFSRRGNKPIDDEEIESWKACRTIEKCATIVVDERNKHGSSDSVRKPASVIVYQNHGQYQPRVSTDTTSRSIYHKRSMDKKSIEIPQTPVLARAPNARVGLTDDTIEGDLAFLPSPKRRNSRLSKLPPLSPRHGRHRSSRSSASVGTLRDHWYGYHTDMELSPRASTDHYDHMPSSAHSDGKHQHVYMSSSNPPRLSLDDEFYLGGLSPRPLLRQSEIGLAVG
ncbi:hypothetical protein CSHISOI_01714 [Colletotrichum shisoi]|uniref:Uncharacterized protein n=1 Tax=Colletotrichum shisoi TaxID=2078593 RepID=A0A5Q4C4B8_9PEZI|nr:hypothetical protein CSHISOI_01714 [Colletotrichum shisoi]